MINPLIIVRDIHFASSMVVGGIIFFDLLIASPILRSDLRLQEVRLSFRDINEKLIWVGLGLSVASALAWLCLLSMRIANKPLDEVLRDATVWIVLTQTQFGVAWEVRLLLAALLAACLSWQRTTDQGAAAIGGKVLAIVSAGGYVGALAFAGHGVEGLGHERNIHLAADFLHLIAASLWVGGLVPFVLLLARLRRLHGDGWVFAAAAAGNRFSTLGILAVGILVASGAINAAFLLNGMHNLIDTSYGQLLLLKIVLFAAMLCLAGINRQHLLPQLRENADFKDSARTVYRLLRNSLAEIALGLVIILIVGTLGVMAPASEMAPHMH